LLRVVLQSNQLKSFTQRMMLTLTRKGGKGETSDGSEVDFGLDDEPADGEAKAFHPTDALLIGGNGGFNPTNDDESVVNFDQNE
jgi:hypothetical protein